MGFEIGRKGTDVFEEQGDLPELVVFVPSAVGEHAGMADAVFGDPEELRFGVLGAYGRKLRRGRDKGVR